MGTGPILPLGPGWRGQAGEVGRAGAGRAEAGRAGNLGRPPGRSGGRPPVKRAGVAGRALSVLRDLTVRNQAGLSTTLAILGGGPGVMICDGCGPGQGGYRFRTNVPSGPVAEWFSLFFQNIIWVRYGSISSYMGGPGEEFLIFCLPLREPFLFLRFFWISKSSKRREIYL